jgi:hypothetical protein
MYSLRYLPLIIFMRGVTGCCDVDRHHTTTFFHTARVIAQQNGDLWSIYYSFALMRDLSDGLEYPIC